MKSRLKAHMGQVRQAYSDMYSVVEKAKSNTDLTQEAKDRIIKEAKEKFKTVSEEKLAAINTLLKAKVDSDKVAIKANYEKNKGSMEYQLGLSNALKMLEIGSSSMNKEDIESLMVPFMGDKVAMGTFTTMLMNSGRQEPELLHMTSDGYQGPTEKALGTVQKGIEENIKLLRDCDYDASLDKLGLSSIAFTPDVFLLSNMEYIDANLDNDLNTTK